MVWDSRGLTLVELLIVLSFLSLILIIGYNLFFFGNTAFVQSESKSNVQREIRMSADLITKELRNATKVSNAAFIDESLYYCVMVDTSNNLLVETVTNGVPTKRILCNGIITEFTCNVIGANKPFVMTFTLKGKDNNMDSEYIITSNVMLNNVEQSTSLTNSLYYTKP